ncbi:glycosyltransferase family protein [bacterium]|nr:glycosyltransferase family protein [bacterium]
METKVTTIIQARMTSTRLPGKVLMEVMARPLLSYQIERLRFSRRIDEIVIATTTNIDDDPVAELATKEGLTVYRGSENDVLDRYYQAARKSGCENVMRITADCPLIDPSICDQIAEYFFHHTMDYVHTGQSFAEGVDCEIFTFAALEKAWKDSTLKSEREHVTLYFRNHPELFTLMTIENAIDDSKYRITVDRQEDYLVVKAIIENLYKGNNEFFKIEEIKTFLELNSEIFAMNKDIVRNEGSLKSISEDAQAHTT